MTARNPLALDDDAEPADPAAGQERRPPPPGAFAPRRVIPATLAGLGPVALVYAIADIQTGALHDVRVVVTTVFLLFGPGWAIAPFLRGRSMAERFVVAAATGTALAILAGQAMAVSGVWHPVALLAGVTVLTVPVLIAHAVRGR